MTRYLELSIKEINKKLKNKEIKPLDLVEECFSRIEENKEYNAFITLNKEDAIRVAKELENKEVALHMYPEGSLWPYYEKVRNFKYGAFKIATLANTPVVPIKFVLEKPTGIYELYKRKPCLHAYILPAIYPDENLEIKDRIADLKDEAERIMKES